MNEETFVEVAGVGEDADPAIALGGALYQAAGALAAAKLGPQHLKEMVWAAPDPASIHPGRRAIDRAWREVFAGFRPQPKIEQSPDEYVHVIVRALRPDGPPSEKKVYQDYSVAELAAQMSPRNQVPDMLSEFRKWTREGAPARAGFGGLDIRYGPKRENIFDLYRPPGASRPPLWCFIHGGYWQAASKDQHAQFCKGMLDAGFAVANIDYPLAPETPLADIVKEVRAALRFIAREAGNPWRRRRSIAYLRSFGWRPSDRLRCERSGRAEDCIGAAAVGDFRPRSATTDPDGQGARPQYAGAGATPVAVVSAAANRNTRSHCPRRARKR